MRMRKLARGHEIVFFITPEIKNSILDCVPVPENDDITTSHILLWTMLQSCKQLVDNMPYWAHQGLQYDRRTESWSEYRKGNMNLDGLRNVLLETENRTLEEMYGVPDNTSEPNDTFISGKLSSLGISEKIH